MVASSGRKKTRAAVVAGSVALALWACATPEIPNTNVSGVKHTLTDVRVDREGDRSVVTLVGLYDPMYSAFQKSDPRMLVLDISEVEIDAASNLVTVYDGIVEHVTLSPYADDLAGPMARVEIALSVDTQLP